MTAPGLTRRQQELHRAVLRAASMFDEQLMLVSVMADRHGCGLADIEAVRDELVAPVLARECGDQK